MIYWQKWSGGHIHETGAIAEEAVDAFKYYEREKWIKVIVEP